LDIIGAVQDAQKETDEGTIVPSGITKHYKSIEYGISDLQVVDFEVSVMVEESKGSEGRLGVISSIVGAGIAGRSSNELSHSSKLKFRIPVQLPTSGRELETPESSKTRVTRKGIDNRRRRLWTENGDSD
jgi:hypothetical protein